MALPSVGLLTPAGAVHVSLVLDVPRAVPTSDGLVGRLGIVEDNKAKAAADFAKYDELK